MAKVKASESTQLPLESFEEDITRASSKTVNLMAREFVLGLTVLGMREIGRMARRMGKALSTSPMEIG